MAKEITDKMIVMTALRGYAKAIWHEVEAGGRYFGTDLYVDLFERSLEIEKIVRKGGTEYCVWPPVD